MLFQVLCGFEPIFYTTHPNEESKIYTIFNGGVAYMDLDGKNYGEMMQ